ncbi:MAG TPA: riboflavin synthase [Vicinamibacterales bacterium]|nr:riboflavin synthase [Vicinamibacterales bacterium]
MFTGLIEATGRVERIHATPSGRVVRVATALGAELKAGESVAVSGVCLTVSSCDRSGFSAIVSPETLRVTTLLTAVEGRLLNLERPLRADGRFGGHFVLGHVDGVGRVSVIRADAECHWLEVEPPEHLMPLIVHKGSIAIDGISLTVAQLSDNRVGVQIVPFTLAETALRETRSGDAVNLEADVIGKYVARLVADRMAAVGRPPQS